MLSSELKSKIKWLWDRFWAGGLSNPITAIEQISYLLFMRRLEFVDNGRLLGKGNQQVKWSYYTAKYRMSDKEIAKYENDNELLQQKINEKNEALLIHIDTIVFPFIKSLNNPHEPFTKAMANAIFLIDKPSLLREAVDTIDSIYYDIEIEQKGGQHFQDTQGDLYEFLLDARSDYVVSWF